MSPPDLPHHVPQHQFSVHGQELVVGGLPLSRLAARVGATPFYAYDRAVIARQVAKLRTTLPKTLELHYAVKANPMPAVVQHLAALVDGFDVASAQELRTALDTGKSPMQISFAGPGKSVAELHIAVAAGVLVNIESARELPLLEHASRALQLPARVAVRINPDFELKGAGVKMTGGARPFGVDVEQVPELLRELAQRKLAFEGFHLFCGAQNLHAQALVEAHTLTFELAMRLAELAPAPLRILNIGGGFGIPYFPGDPPLDLGPIAAGLELHLARAAQRLPGMRVVLELGRYLVGEAGVYVCRVVDSKLSRGKLFYVTDGGLHHHLAASGNFGQVLRKNYPACIGTRMQSVEQAVANVVGPLCTPLDVLVQQMELAHADVGDLVVIFQSGAYGLSASPTQFLGHPMALEVLV